jgi:predicted anti-sigma-YlaC factor YlaD
MASCRKFKALIDLYLDGEADDRQTEILFSHMRNCEGCRDRFEEVENLHRAIKSAPALELPGDFRSAVMARIQSERRRRPSRSMGDFLHRFIGFPAVMSWAGAAVAILLVSAIAWYIYNPGPALAVPEIHIVSPREDAVVEQQYVDISAAFTFSIGVYPRPLKNIRVILDTRDVTDATEVNEDFLIYTSDALQSGYHMATIQITDNTGAPVSQRSWAFYVIR